MSRLPPVTLEGRFVRLEPLAPSHTEPLLQAASADRATYAFTRVPASLEAMRAYVDEALDLQARDEALPFATLDSRQSTVVGTTRFASIEFWKWAPGVTPKPPCPAGPDSVEIGWTWLAASAQRTAINTEAKLLMLTQAFETWGVRKVMLKTDRRNSRSRSAIQRIGGTLDGVLRSHMPAYDGEVRDTALFSILSAEWPAAKAKLQTRLG
jgi:RimJ/RimL family protein N-acetyltransferase